MKNGYRLFITIIALSFIIFLIGSFITGIILIVHAIKNPDMTLTQLFLWYIIDKDWWTWIVGLMITYIIIGIEGNKNK